MILITPLKTYVAGSTEEQKSAVDLLDKATEAVSEALSRWPKVKAIFDAGEERFLSKSDARGMGLI